MSDNMRQSIKCVAVLVVLTLVCVLLLAVFKDILFVAPDPKKFSDTHPGQYEVVDVTDITVVGGKVKMAGEGTDQNGDRVIGLYVVGKSAGKGPGDCEAIVIIDRTTHTIVALSIVKDGSTDSSYRYSTDNLDDMIGERITSADVFNNINYNLKSGATQTCKTFRNVYICAAQYYYSVYVEGQQ